MSSMMKIDHHRFDETGLRYSDLRMILIIRMRS